MAVTLSLSSVLKSATRGGEGKGARLKLHSSRAPHSYVLLVHLLCARGFLTPRTPQGPQGPPRTNAQPCPPMAEEEAS